MGLLSALLLSLGVVSGLAPASALAGKQTELAVPTGGPAGGIAVNNASGDVYVQNFEGEERIERYDEAGNLLGQFGGPGSANGQFMFFDFYGSPAVVQPAIDQSDGTIYVPDPGNNRVQKFAPDGTYVGQLGPEVPGNGEMFGPQAVAVDPTSGDVLVLDPGNLRVLRFSSAGIFEAVVLDATDFGLLEDEDGGPIAYGTPSQIVLDSSGATYVLARANNQIRRFTPSGALDMNFGHVGILGSSGRGAYVLDPLAIGIDPVTDHLLIAGNTLGGVPRVFDVDRNGAIVEEHAFGIPAAGSGIAASPDGERYFVTQAFSSQYFVLTDAGAPPGAVSIDPPTGVTNSEATFSGTVNPDGGFETSWNFEYSSDGGQTWVSTPGGSAGSGTTDVPVSETISGLEPSQDYLVRLVANKQFGAGSRVTPALSFTTDSVPPVVEALDPGPVAATTAWLGAFVNPGNSPTNFYVEYSTDPGFAASQRFPVGPAAVLKEGGKFFIATQLVQGLAPSTTYFYRVTAASEGGTTVGETRSFATEAPGFDAPSTGLPDGRVWEKVSPDFKNGTHIDAGNQFNSTLIGQRSQASLDGEAVSFGSKGKFAGGRAAPTVSQYIARRGVNGWTTESVNPPLAPSSGNSNNKGTDNVDFFQWFSEDLSLGVATAYAALNPGDTEFYNLYLRDNSNGSYTTLSNFTPTTPRVGFYELQGVSPDSQHFIFNQYSNPSEPLMERTRSGALRPVSILPDGSIVPGFLGSGNQRDILVGFNAISTDASRVFFSTGLEYEGSLYLREDAERTTLVSASEREGDDPDIPHTGDFLAAARDGSVAYFRSSEALTDGAPAPEPGGCVIDSPAINWVRGQPCDLYRWVADAPAGERLQNITSGGPDVAAVIGVVGVSEDGGTIYFVSFGDLDGRGRSDGSPNLYVWHEGDQRPTYITSLVGGNSHSDWGVWSRQQWRFSRFDLNNDEPYKAARVTPDGRFVTYASQVPQVAYDTAGKIAIYRYDRVTGRTTCISCSTIAPRSKGDSWFISCAAEDGGETNCHGTEYLARNFSADGRRLFFDSADSLIPSDTNGVTDVYVWQDGKLHLISSGTSAFPSRFVDSGGGGRDVFFTTAQQLTPSDQDQLRDLYDARIGGRLEPPLVRPCVADECQGTPAPPPNFPAPGSASLEAAPKGKPVKPRCRKGKVRHKGHCVKRHQKRRAAHHKKRGSKRAGAQRSGKNNHDAGTGR